MATGNFPLYFAVKHSAQVMPVQATRLTDTHATIGGKRHALRDEAGILMYFTDKTEAYKAVLAQRLADAQYRAQQLAEFVCTGTVENMAELEAVTYMVALKNGKLRSWIEYGAALQKAGEIK